MVTRYVIQVKYFTCVPSIIGLGAWLGLSLISLTLIGFLITTCFMTLYIKIWGFNRRDLIPHIFLRNFSGYTILYQVYLVVTWLDWRLQIAILIQIPTL